MALVKIARCTDGRHADSKRSSSNGGRVCQTSNSWNPMPTPAKVKALCNEDVSKPFLLLLLKWTCNAGKLQSFR